MQEQDWGLIVGGGGSNAGCGEGWLDDEWPPVVDNGFTGV